MTANSGPGSASTAFAVARLRRWRRDQVVDTLGELAASGLAILLLLSVWLGARALPALSQLDAPPVPAWLVPIVLLGMVVVIAGIPALLVGLFYALLVLLLDLLRLPGLVRWLTHRRRERALEEQLLREGWLPAPQGALDPTLTRLLEREPELVVVDGRARVVGPVPDTCPSCSAPLTQPGPGLRACPACDYDRYDPLPPASPRWAGARVEGPTRLLDRVRAEHPRFSPTLRVGGALAAMMIAGAVVSAVLTPLGLDDAWVLTPSALGFMVAPFALPMLAWCGWVVARVAARDLPRLLAHRRAVRDEVLRLTAAHGAIHLDAVADQLGISADDLATEVTVLTARGDLPIYHDREGDRLVSRFCEGVDSRCPACGGQAEPCPRGLVCVACDTVVLPLRSAGARSSVAPAEPDTHWPTGRASSEGWRLTLKLPHTTTTAGDRLRARLQLDAPASARCDRLVLKVVRRVHDRLRGAVIETTTWEQELLRFAEVHDTLTRDVAVLVPRAEVSWTGELLQVEVVVRALFTPGEVVAELPITVTPAEPDLTARFVRWTDDERERFIEAALVLGLPAVATLTGVFAWVASSSRGGVTLTWMLAAVLTPLYGAWSFWQGLRARRLATLVGIDGELQTAIPGATVTFRYRLRGEVQHAAWELVLVERAGHEVTVPGARRPQRRLRHDQRRHVLGGGPLSSPEGTTQFTVPRDAPASLRVGWHELSWQLRISLTHAEGTRTVEIPLTVRGG